jgi:hypothetical protein
MELRFEGPLGLLIGFLTLGLILSLLPYNSAANKPHDVRLLSLGVSLGALFIGLFACAGFNQSAGFQHLG